MKIKLSGRLIAAGLCVLMCAAACLTCFAAGNTFTIKECGDLQITLPENMSAVTRSSDSNDPYFARHGLSFSDVQEMFLKDDTYLQAMDNDNVIALTLSYSDAATADFSTFSSAELAAVARNFVSQRNENVTFNSSTLDEVGKDVVWLYFNITVHDDTNNIDKKQVQATTVHDGKSVVLTMQRNAGDVEAADFDTLQAISQTVKFPGKGSWLSNKNLIIFGAIGVGVLAVIILIIIIAVSVKKSKKKKAKSRNDKILEELADKYQVRPAQRKPAPEQTVNSVRVEPAQQAPSEDDEQYQYTPETDNSYYEDDAGYDDEPKSKYSDEDLARLLGDLDD